MFGETRKLLSSLKDGDIIFEEKTEVFYNIIKNRLPIIFGNNTIANEIRELLVIIFKKFLNEIKNFIETSKKSINNTIVFAFCLLNSCNGFIKTLDDFINVLKENTQSYYTIFEELIKTSDIIDYAVDQLLGYISTCKIYSESVSFVGEDEILYGKRKEYISLIVYSSTYKGQNVTFNIKFSKQRGETKEYIYGDAVIENSGCFNYNMTEKVK